MQWACMCVLAARAKCAMLHTPSRRPGKSVHTSAWQGPEHSSTGAAEQGSHLSRQQAERVQGVDAAVLAAEQARHLLPVAAVRGAAARRAVVAAASISRSIRSPAPSAQRGCLLHSAG